MFRLRLILFVIVFALWQGVLQAQIIIDPFTTDAGPYNTSPPSSSGTTSFTVGGRHEDRRLSVQGTGAGSGSTVVGSGIWLIDGSASGTDTFSALDEYNGFTPLNLNSSPYLLLDVGAVNGSGALTFSITLQNASGGQVLGSTPLTLADSNSTLVFDVRQMAGYTPGFLDNVNDIALGLGVTNGSGSPVFSRIAFSSTPEPSTWAMLGMGVTVLLVGYRRRRS